MIASKIEIKLGTDRRELSVHAVYFLQSSGVLGVVVIASGLSDVRFYEEALSNRIYLAPEWKRCHQDVARRYADWCLPVMRSGVWVHGGE